MDAERFIERFKELNPLSVDGDIITTSLVRFPYPKSLFKPEVHSRWDDITKARYVATLSFSATDDLDFLKFYEELRIASERAARKDDYCYKHGQNYQYKSGLLRAEDISRDKETGAIRPGFEAGGRVIWASNTEKPEVVQIRSGQRISVTSEGIPYKAVPYGIARLRAFYFGGTNHSFVKEGIGYKIEKVWLIDPETFGEPMKLNLN